MACATPFLFESMVQVLTSNNYRAQTFKVKLSLAELKIVLNEI